MRILTNAFRVCPGRVGPHVAEVAVWCMHSAVPIAEDVPGVATVCDVVPDVTRVNAAPVSSSQIGAVAREGERGVAQIYEKHSDESQF